MQLPNTSVELIDDLDRMFPEQVPQAGDSMETIQRYAGKRELVLLLKHWRDATKKDRPIRRGSR